MPTVTPTPPSKPPAPAAAKVKLNDIDIPPIVSAIKKTFAGIELKEVSNFQWILENVTKNEDDLKKDTEYGQKFIELQKEYPNLIEIAKDKTRHETLAKALFDGFNKSASSSETPTPTEEPAAPPASVSETSEPTPKAGSKK